jgi:oligoendopeptidase F
MFMPMTVPIRKEIPFEHTWSVETIFPDDKAWATEFDSLVKELPALEKYRGHLSENPAKLAEWFNVSEAVQFRAGKVSLYASLKF